MSPPTRKTDRGHRPLKRVFALAVAAMATLALTATPALADTGSVFFNSSTGNVGAGFDFFNNDHGQYNTGLGIDLMPSLTTGINNVTIGTNALVSNTSGRGNTATGSMAMQQNTTGNSNVAYGYGALWVNNGTGNVGIGRSALGTNQTGSQNVAEGMWALANVKTGNNNIAVGSRAGASSDGSNNIYIGNTGLYGESRTIRIGSASQNAAYLAGVWKKTIPGPTKDVVVNANGQLGTSPAATKPASVHRLQTQVKELRSEVQRLQAQVRNGR